MNIRKILGLILQVVTIAVAFFFFGGDYKDETVKNFVYGLSYVMVIYAVTRIFSVFENGLPRLKQFLEVLFLLSFMEIIVTISIRIRTEEIVPEVIFTVVVYCWRAVVKQLCAKNEYQLFPVYSPSAARISQILFLSYFSLFVASFGHCYNVLFAMCMDELLGDLMRWGSLLWVGFSAFTLFGLYKEFGPRAKAVWVTYGLILLIILIGAVSKFYNKRLFSDYDFRTETVIELLKGEKSHRFE